MEKFEVYPYEGAPFTASLDEDKNDGSWIVWDGTYHYGFGLTEEEAKKTVDDLMDGYMYAMDMDERY